MSGTLLDSSVVISLLRHEHVHRDAARRWFRDNDGPFSTCPITQGAMIRVSVQRGESMSTAMRALSSLTSHERHEFWPDDIAYTQVPPLGVLGHRQVTDAYLAELARRHGGRVVTLDRAFASLHPDVTDLVPAP